MLLRCRLEPAPLLGPWGPILTELLGGWGLAHTQVTRVVHQQMPIFKVQFQLCILIVFPVIHQVPKRLEGSSNTSHFDYNIWEI